MTQRISSDRVLMLTKEACKIAGLSHKHIQRLLREKRIDGIKLGHDWLVYEDSLHLFLAQSRKRGPKGPHKRSAAEDSNNPPVNTDAVHQEKKSDKS